ncbi:hypothetical protein BD560DRAFT_52054 [Blakeslea trispora]|nr:hypothetical protein BD560DRAFT_52054 [Blakeslea trispora]
MIEELTEQHDLVMTEANLTDSGSSSESDSSSDSESDSGSESDTSSMAELITDIDNTIDEHHEEPIHKIDTPKQDLPLVLKDVKNPVDHVRFSPVESSPIVNYTLMHDQVYETVVEDIEIDDQLEPVIKDAIRPIQSRIESVPINQEEVEFALTMNDSAIDEEAIEVDSPKTRLPDLFQRINFSGSIFVTEEAYATYTTKKSCPEECQATFDTLTKLQSARRPGRREAQAKSSPTPSIPSQPSSPIKRSMDTREIGETKKSKPNMPSVAQSPLDILLPDKATRVLTRAQSHLSNDLQTASSTASTEPEPRSRFSKEDHKRFIMLFDKLRKNGKLPEPENKWYQQMLKDLEEEKSLFLKTQRSKILQSGVYSIIEPKLSALYHAHYTYQLERRHRYPVSAQGISIHSQLILSMIVLAILCIS